MGGRREGGREKVPGLGDDDVVDGLVPLAEAREADLDDHVWVVVWWKGGRGVDFGHSGDGAALRLCGGRKRSTLAAGGGRQGRRLAGTGFPDEVILRDMLIDSAIDNCV